MTQPTNQQKERWRQLDRQIQAVDHLTRSNMARLKALAIANKFSQEQGLEPVIWTGISPFDEGLKLQIANKRLSTGRRGVNQEKLGLQFFADGEVNIMAPASMPPEEVRYWKGLAGWPIIAIGIAIVVGVVGTIALLKSENARLKKKVNWQHDQLNENFCQDPGSSLCNAWEQRKKDSGYDREIGLSETLDDMAGQIGGALKKGSMWGLVIAIPLIAYMLLGRRR
jgi:hypothetical protein